MFTCYLHKDVRVVYFWLKPDVLTSQLDVGIESEKNVRKIITESAKKNAVFYPIKYSYGSVAAIFVIKTKQNDRTGYNRHFYTSEFFGNILIGVSVAIFVKLVQIGKWRRAPSSNFV